MNQIIATPQTGDRLIIGTFMAGQIVMLDTTDRYNPKEVSVVSFGAHAGPHARQPAAANYAPLEHAMVYVLRNVSQPFTDGTGTCPKYPIMARS